MPKVTQTRSRHTRDRASPLTDVDSSAANITHLTKAAMRALPVEVLRLHLSSRNLVTTGNRPALAKRLHEAVHSETNADATPSPLPQLEQTVQSLVDKSLEGLESRLQASLRSMLHPGSGSAAPPAPPTHAVDRVEDDNISLPSNAGTPLHLSLRPPPPVDATVQPLQLPAIPAIAEQMPADADTAVITRTIPAPATPPTTPPAVPAKLRQRILRGEYIDFDSLLPESMFPARFCTASTPSLTLRLSTEPSSGGDGVVVAQPRPASKRSVSDLSSWLEAWNGYVATLVSQFPYRAASLLAYQRIICQASLHAPPVAWLRYDSRFRALAAEDKSLRWDHKLNDLWLECFSLVAASPSHAAAYPSPKTRRPCTYCGATTHYPDNCSSNPFRAPRSSPPTTGPSRPPASLPQHAAPTFTPPTNRSSPFACRDHNQHRCTRPSCRFKHVCALCGDRSHIKWDCPQHRPN